MHLKKQAIKTIKKILLVLLYVPYEKIDYLILSNEALLHLARFINKKECPNFRILYALYKSQVAKDEKSIKRKAIRRLIQNLIERFKCITSVNKKLSAKYKSNFY